MVPDKSAPFSAVKGIPQIWGLNGHIQDFARRLAKEGYVALVPDLSIGEWRERMRLGQDHGWVCSRLLWREPSGGSRFCHSGPYVRDLHGKGSPHYKSCASDSIGYGGCSKIIHVKIFGGTKHAFSNDTRPMYTKDAAPEAWQDVLYFLAKD